MDSMEETTANVDMVSAAVEEMTSTINEIAEVNSQSRHAGRLNQLADRSVKVVGMLKV